MESLLSKLKDPDYLKNDNESVMDRLEWLNHLSLIFNLTLNIPLRSPSSSSLKTEAFLNTLIENFTRLPLKPISLYRSQSSVKCISFKELFIIFEHDFGKTLTWDQIMERIMAYDAQFNVHKRQGSESPGSLDLNELVFISKRLGSSSADYESEPKIRSRKLSDLRIPQTPPSIGGFSLQGENVTPRGSHEFMTFTRACLRVPEFHEGLAGYSNNETKLNLSFKKISVLSQKLPLGLIQLNLSHNQIERFPNLEELKKLEFLNLNWNFITSLGGTRPMNGLKELYLAHNKLQEIDSLGFCEDLVIFDLSYNKIHSVQALAGLCQNRNLRAVDLEGNLLTQQSGYKDKVLALVPQLVELSSNGICKLTKFPKSMKKWKTKELKKSNSLRSKKHK